MKKSFLILTVYCLLFTAVFAQETAQPTEYELLAPLPGYVETTAENKTTATQYIGGIFKLIIAIAGLLAVIMIIFGGIKYMSTDAFTGKSDAKSIIENAIWGLLLTISAWLILATINPNLVNFDLKIPVQEIRSPAPSTPQVGGAPVVPGISAGQPWTSDSDIRSDLTSSEDIFINKANCAKIGDANCTSLAGMSSNVVNKIKSLAQNCRCLVTVTGGTEYWLHGNRSTEIDLNPTAHKPGGNVVDLNYYTGVTNYIRARGTQTTASGCSNLGSEKYTLNGATYVLENYGGTHWHVCF